MPGKVFKEKVLWLMSSIKNEKTGGGTDLRVMQWVVDGKDMKPCLEKRDFFLGAQGDRQAGKCKGFTVGDLYEILRNLRKIAGLMEMKPEQLDQALQLGISQARPTSAPTTEKSKSN